MCWGDLDSGLFLHPPKHIVNTVDLHRFSCCIPFDIDKQIFLFLQDIPVFSDIIKQKFKSIIADTPSSFFCILRSCIVLIILSEIHPDFMRFIIDVFRIINFLKFHRYGIQVRMSVKSAPDPGSSCKLPES